MSNLNTHGVVDYESAQRFMSGLYARALCYTKALCYATNLMHGQSNGVHYIDVYHHGTQIIRYWSNGRIDIRNGGYLSVSTTTRLNNMTPSGVLVSSARGGSVSLRSDEGEFVKVLDYQPLDWYTVVEAGA